MEWWQKVIVALEAKPTGRAGYWKLRCPLHEDRRPSAVLWLFPGGRALGFGCHSCRARWPGNDYKLAALARVGLKMRDLFQSSLEKGNDAYDKKNRMARPFKMQKVAAVYPYVDEKNVVLYEKVRYIDPKDFKARRPDGQGGHIWSLEGIRRVPFCLPLLLKDRESIVYLVEGEKDALTAQSLGLCSTCVTEGAGSGWFDDTYTPFFACRHVVVIPDEDEAGCKHARHIVGWLLTAGASSVRLLRLPLIQPKGDLSDWVEMGGTRQQIDALTASAPHWGQACSS